MFFFSLPKCWALSGITWTHFSYRRHKRTYLVNIINTIKIAKGTQEWNIEQNIPKQEMNKKSPEMDTKSNFLSMLKYNKLISHLCHMNWALFQGIIYMVYSAKDFYAYWKLVPRFENGNVFGWFSPIFRQLYNTKYQIFVLGLGKRSDRCGFSLNSIYLFNNKSRSMRIGYWLRCCSSFICWYENNERQ